MTIVNGYCTLAEYKSWNTIDTTNATDDTVIEDIIESISRQIDNLCSRVFYTAAASAQYYTADFHDILFVDDISTSAGLIVAVDYDGDGVYEITWASTDYNLTPYQSNNGYPYMMIEVATLGVYRFPYTRRGVKVTAAWGWAAVPDDVKTACLIGVDAEYHARNGQNLSTDTTITGAGVVITPRGLPASAKEKLKPYVRRVQ